MSESMILASALNLYNVNEGTWSLDYLSYYVCMLTCMCLCVCDSVSGRDSHLTWETRVRVLRDCSFALKYLHHHIEGCVVHRDIKVLISAMKFLTHTHTYA